MPLSSWIWPEHSEQWPTTSPGSYSRFRWRPVMWSPSRRHCIMVENPQLNPHRTGHGSVKDSPFKDYRRVGLAYIITPMTT